MTQIQLAAIAAAGTAAVLAPIDPQAIRDLLDEFDAAVAIPEPPAPVLDAHLIARARTALYLPHWQPTAEFGETETRVSRWSVLELNDTYMQVGGAVTARQVEVTLSDASTFTTTEITVTADLPGIGRVEVFTHWDAEVGRTDLPVMRALTTALAA